MLLETIMINQSVLQNIDSHIQRMNDSARALGIKSPMIPDLLSLLPNELRSKKVKCSITYDTQLLDIKFVEYIPRNINSLKLVCSDIGYEYKFSDRSKLMALTNKRENCDEVLIVKDKYITDTSFSNVVFGNDDGLFTPDTYLLNGTKRQLLLRKKIIKEIPITTNDLEKYNKVYLINALMDIGDIVVNIDKVK